MSLTKEQIIDAIAEMSVMDVVELVSAMEEKIRRVCCCCSSCWSGCSC